MKCVEQLRQRGLYAIMVVKNNHKNYPRSCLENIVTDADDSVVGDGGIADLQDVVEGAFQQCVLQRGEWVSFVRPST